MKYAVVEAAGEWIVRRDGLEMARFGDQHQALAHVADLLRGADRPDGSVSLAMHYLARA